MGTLGKRIQKMEEEIRFLKTKLASVSANVESKNPKPYSIVEEKDKSQIRAVDIRAGLGMQGGSPVVWNDAELRLPSYGTKPDDPVKGYNKHAHSRYAGGALDISTLELVEYDFDATPNFNKHSQQYWTDAPIIKIEQNAEGEDIEKIGNLDLIFDPEIKKWTLSEKLIDVETAYFVQYEWKKDGVVVPAGTEGATKEILKDGDGNDMKSPLLYTSASVSTAVGRNKNLRKSNVYWDKSDKCWRFYAVFKPYPEEE